MKLRSIKLSLGLGSLLSTVYLNAHTYTVTKGWNLLGAVNSIEVSSLDNISLLWSYTNGEWSAISPDGSRSDSINSLGYSDDNLKINSGEGFWIYSSIEQILTFDDSVITSSNNISYRVVDTNQTECFSSSGVLVDCANTEQDGNYINTPPSYTSIEESIILDNNTNLMWEQTADKSGDNIVNVSDKMTQEEAINYCQNLELGGYSDWRLPDIKSIYSLMDFSGSDPSGETGDDTSSLKPFINDEVFGFGYGDTSAGERVIDAQWATATNYVSTTMNGDETMFGLNLADGRIKGYGLSLFGNDKTFYVQCVRGNESYGQNSFVDNEDLTISDNATNLMWSKDDSIMELNWDDALDYCQDSTLAGYSDWKLPNAKELQTIVDYSRSPDTTNSASIDSIFSSTPIVNEAGISDFGFYWSSTTHKSSNGMGASAVYISFGRSLGYMNQSWMDAHGAGAQRSDPKDISLVNTSNSSYTIIDEAITHGPQGDVIRGKNFVRCTREIE